MSGASVRPQHPLDKLVGPFYDAMNLSSYLAVTPTELEALVDSGQVLETKLGDGTRVYPTFQFADGRPLPHLDEVIGALNDPGYDGWSIGIMLNVKESVWGDRTAADLLRGDWAEEVLHQLKFDERAPLEKRARFAEQYEIAWAVLDELLPRIDDLHIGFNPATAIVGEGEDGFGAGVLVTDTTKKRSVLLLSFSLSGDLGTIVNGLETELRQRHQNGASD